MGPAVELKGFHAGRFTGGASGSCDEEPRVSRQICMNPAMTEYLRSVSLRETEIAARLRAETAAHPYSQMQIGPEQAQFMAFMVELIGARSILEVGTFTGYSALWMAESLPEDGHIDTCDVDLEATAVARRYWDEAGVGQRIHLHLGPALQTLTRFQREKRVYDLAFVDADKENIEAYCQLSLGMLRAGGLLMVDNVLWAGRVADPLHQDPATQALRRLNRALGKDLSLSVSMVPIGDGLLLVRAPGSSL